MLPPKRAASRTVALTLIALLAPACATVGLRCEPGAAICAQVRRYVEVARAHAGEPESEELHNARLEVTRIGSRAVPFLVTALDDGEPAVAAFSARALIEMGREAEVTRWCQGPSGNTDIFCSERTSQRR